MKWSEVRELYPNQFVKLKVLSSHIKNEQGIIEIKRDWLYIANNKDTKKGLFRVPYYIHYFVSINEQRMPSEFGIVKNINRYITARELAELDYKSRKKDLSLLTDENIKEDEWFLDKVNAQPEHTPMAVTWLEKTFPKKEKELRVLKKLFTGLSKEEKKELFET